jgi:S-adenosylmethionine:tRNA ribosyltransferase-isomerase
MIDTFELPDELAAAEPPEQRGVTRDQVRLLVASPSGIEHTRFAGLPDSLSPGDLVVVNTSATLAAAVDGQRADGRGVTVHFSTPREDGTWLVELRPPVRATGPVSDAAAGETVTLAMGVLVTLLSPQPGATPTRLWRARIDVEGGVERYLARHGRPISYAYVNGQWPISMYQTVFARRPGSAEMPSAGRPFTPELVTSLVAAGVVIAPITLHTGVSSLEEGEPPLAERFEVSPATARLVNLTKASGGRIVAVGTTVTRALETIAHVDGWVGAGSGWTDLVLGPDRPARVVDGLITGWHAPGASHLMLLEAVAGSDLVSAAYGAAVRERYLWHEFGDSCLLLPDREAA